MIQSVKLIELPYHKHNNGCRKDSKSIPRNATKDVNGWVCNYGYKKVDGSMCVRN